MKKYKGKFINVGTSKNMYEIKYYVNTKKTMEDWLMDFMLWIDRENTAKGDGWVEYSYVINLKENTLGVYGAIIVTGKQFQIGRAHV